MGGPSDYFELMRPVNSIMVGVAIIVGALITGGTWILNDLFVVFYSLLSGFTLTGASMAINDYYDRKIDTINEPHRPIPSGRVSASGALLFSFILSVIGLFFSWLVSLGAFALAVFAWFMMMVYSMWGKSTGFLGNLMVSTCISLPFVYGGLLSDKIWTSLSFSIIAFLSNTGREITKGIVDVDGDKVDGVNTIAVVHGAKNAAYIAVLFYIAAVVASLIPILLELVSFWYIPFIVVTDLGLIFSSYQIINNPGRETSRSVKNRILYLMIIGLIGFAAGSLF